MSRGFLLKRKKAVVKPAQSCLPLELHDFLLKANTAAGEKARKPGDEKVQRSLRSALNDFLMLVLIEFENIEFDVQLVIEDSNVVWRFCLSAIDLCSRLLEKLQPHLNKYASLQVVTDAPSSVECTFDKEAKGYRNSFDLFCAQKKIDVANATSILESLSAHRA